jgi:molybdate transport system ATP-binding protein
MKGLRANFSRGFPGGTEVKVDNFEAGSGVTVLFGPSGAGKTTILRCLAGLDKPEAGEIHFNDRVWFRRGARQAAAGRPVFVPPEQRRIGFVPQDYALFPHLTVAENIAYGLDRMPSSEKRLRVGEAMDWLGIAGLTARQTHQLSGGEAQRVALARALAPRPQLLLLDEPLSALDAPTRQRLRGELAELLARLHTPAVLVTHDRLEAAALGREIFVLADGRFLQRGAVADVFNRPANLDVARLVGMDTVLSCEVVGSENGLATLAAGTVRLTAMADQLPEGNMHVHVCIRAEDVVLSPDMAGRTSSRNHLVGVIESMTSEGPLVRVDVECGFRLAALLTRQSCEELRLARGSNVTALVKVSQVHVF